MTEQILDVVARSADCPELNPSIVNLCLRIGYGQWGFKPPYCPRGDLTRPVLNPHVDCRGLTHGIAIDILVDGHAFQKRTHVGRIRIEETHKEPHCMARVEITRKISN